MNPAERVITLQWVNNQMAGDEALELWKKVAGVWSLVESIPVASTPEQTHEFTGAPGTAYVFQIRGRRDGAYRTDYQSANPDDWPTTSRLAYTAELPVGVLAFTGWSRTSGVRQILSFAWTNTDPARAVRFYRNDGGGYDLIATIAAGTSVYEWDIGAESATTPNFKIDQEDDDAVATDSNALAAYAGPAHPTALAQSGSLADDEYTAEWVVGQAGASTRISDHWTGVYQDRILTAADATSGFVDNLESNDPAIPSVTVTVNVRVRHEITQFAVTDVSEWTADVLFNVRTAAGNTLYMGP